MAGNRRSSALLFWVLLVASLAAIASDQIHVGKVVSIADGDTLTLREEGQQVRVRLAHIDTPELGQPFGDQAKAALSDLTFGKQVRVVEVDWDRYGRLVGEMYVGDTYVNAELLRSGNAWMYRKYSNDQELLELEAEARKAGRGLWAGNPIAPWAWRQGERGGDVHGEVIANRRSGIYHLPNCPDYHRVAEGNRVLYQDESAAMAAGFRRAGNCPQ